MLDDKLIEAVSELFGMAPGEVAPETGRETVPEWDSLSHLRLILAVESAFDVRFPAAAIPRLTSVGQIQEALNRIPH